MPLALALRNTLTSLSGQCPGGTGGDQLSPSLLTSPSPQQDTSTCGPWWADGGLPPVWGGDTLLSPCSSGAGSLRCHLSSSLLPTRAAAAAGLADELGESRGLMSPCHRET